MKEDDIWYVDQFSWKGVISTIRSINSTICYVTYQKPDHLVSILHMNIVQISWSSMSRSQIVANFSVLCVTSLGKSAYVSNETSLIWVTKFLSMMQKFLSRLRVPPTPNPLFKKKKNHGSSCGIAEWL